MERISCCLNHFGVVEIPDVQKNRHLKTGQSAIELKRDTNLSIVLASLGCLDACHLDLKFFHLPARGLWLHRSLLTKHATEFRPARPHTMSTRNKATNVEALPSRSCATAKSCGPITIIILRSRTTLRSERSPPWSAGGARDDHPSTSSHGLEHVVPPQA